MKPNPLSLVKTAGVFALGAAAGSAAAFLYAPASGRATRKKIALKFNSLKRSSTQQVLKAKKTLVRKAGDLRHAAVEKLSDTQEWFKERIGNGDRPAPRRVHS